MAASRHHLPLLAVTIALCLATLAVAASPDDTTTLAPSPEPPQPTVCEMLERYNFTQGILPEGVTWYVLRPDGSFEVYLPGDCSFCAGRMAECTSGTAAASPAASNPWRSAASRG